MSASVHSLCSPRTAYRSPLHALIRAMPSACCGVQGRVVAVVAEGGGARLGAAAAVDVRPVVGLGLRLLLRAPVVGEEGPPCPPCCPPCPSCSCKKASQALASPSSGARRTLLWASLSACARADARAAAAASPSAGRWAKLPCWALESSRALSACSLFMVGVCCVLVLCGGELGAGCCAVPWRGESTRKRLNNM
jgi:hypothetical protein